ncbi:MAG: hypothetical protein V3U69_05740, partial [Bacteroidota bacterium]
MKPILTLFAGILLLCTWGDINAKNRDVRPTSSDRVALIRNSTTGSEYLAGVVLIKLKTYAGALEKGTVGIAELDAAIAPYGVREVRRVFPHHPPSQAHKTVDLSRFVVVEYTSPIDPASLAKELSAHPAVDYAEPKYISYLDLIPN